MNYRFCMEIQSVYGTIMLKEVIILPEELFGIDIIYYIIALIVIAIITVYLMVSYFIYKRIMVNHNNPPIDLVDHTEEYGFKKFLWKMCILPVTTI